MTSPICLEDYSRRSALVLSCAALIFTMLTLAQVAEAQQQRHGDRFGLRVGAWPVPDVAGTLATVGLSGDTLIYDAVVDEPAQVIPFLELYGLFNLRGIWWVEVSAGFAQRTDVDVKGVRLEPIPANDTTPEILLGSGRVDLLPLFLGLRAVRTIGGAERPHNLFGRGGVSMLIAAEQPSAVYPSLQGDIYTEGTKAAFGLALGIGGEYYVGRKVGLLADVQYRLADLNYSDNGDYNVSGIWAAVGVTIRVR